MIARETVICYGILDADCVFHSQVAREGCDTVMFCVKGFDGELHHFESEAYHLGAWCKELGLALLRAEKEVKFNLVPA